MASDKERLDWLEKYRSMEDMLPNWQGLLFVEQGKTIRKAIDAAMKKAERGADGK